MKTTTYYLEWRNGPNDQWAQKSRSFKDAEEPRQLAPKWLEYLEGSHTAPQIRLIRTTTETDELPLLLEPVPQV